MELKFRNREERRAYMARRYIKTGKPIPYSKRYRNNSPPTPSAAVYNHGFFTRAIHFLGNILVRYPVIVAAGILAVGAYTFFQKANAITQLLGGFALTTLVVANPDASVKMIQKTHEYMTFGVKTVGEGLSSD
jgi:hypothetical protein